LRNNGTPGHFSLEGVWNGTDPLPALLGDSSIAGGEALTTVYDDGSFSSEVDTIKNLAVRDFVMRFGETPHRSSGGAFNLGRVLNGIHNVHFENNSSDREGALSVKQLSGGIHNARFIGNHAFENAALAVDTLDGGLNNSVFIGNRAQLPGDFPALPIATAQEAVGSAATLQNNVELRNNTFLANSSSLINAQNPTLASRGAAVVHLTDDASGASSVAIVGEAGERTLFYGNTHNAGSGYMNRPGYRGGSN